MSESSDKLRKRPLRKWDHLQIVGRKQVTCRHRGSHCVQGRLPPAVTQKHLMAEQGNGHLDLQRPFRQSVTQPSHFGVWHLHIFLQFFPQSAQQSFQFSPFSLKNKLFGETQEEKAILNGALIVQLITGKLGNAGVRGLCSFDRLLLTDRYVCVHTHVQIYAEEYPVLLLLYKISHNNWQCLTPEKICNATSLLLVLKVTWKCNMFVSTLFVCDMISTVKSV